MPEETAAASFSERNDWLGLDSRGFIPIDPAPAFDTEVIEETDRYIISRDEWGMVRKALKVDTIRCTRASTDQYLDYPAKPPGGSGAALMSTQPAPRTASTGSPPSFVSAAIPL